MSKPKGLLLTKGGHARLPNTRAILEDVLSNKAGLDLTTDVDYSEMTPERLSQYDVIINYSGYKADIEPSDEHVLALINAVENGTPYLPIHVATLLFKNQLDYHERLGHWPTHPEPNDLLNEIQLRYLEMTGSSFLGHGPIETFTLELKDRDHPILRGIDDFETTDELYVLGYDPAPLHVLAEARGEPLFYTRQWGKGKVFYNALGHDQHALSNPIVQQVIVQSVAWALSDA